MALKLFACPERGCYHRLLLDENASTAHKCPHGGDTKIGYNITMSILSDLWEELDKLVDQIIPATQAKDPTDPAALERNDLEHLKGQAKGIATALALFMSPFFRTTEEVSREAGVRRKARLGGEVHTTPGLAERKFEFPGDDKYGGNPPQALAPGPSGRRRPAPETGRGTGGATGHATQTQLPIFQLNDKQKSGIIQAKGLMTAEELATIYKVPSQTILEIWKE